MFTAAIEIVASCTLNMPPDEIKQALKSGSIRLNEKQIKAGEEVTVKPGDIISNGSTHVTILHAHLTRALRAK